MQTIIEFDVQTGAMTTRSEPFTAQHVARQAQSEQEAAAAAARQAERDARLAAVPSNEQSIIVLRDKVNAILAELRGD